MKKLFLLSVSILLLLPTLSFAEVTYLNDNEYKKLSKNEREQYWNNLNQEMASLQKRKADALKSMETDKTEIDRLKQEIKKLDEKIAEKTKSLGVADNTFSDLKSKIQYYKDQLDNWEKMSDSQLWENAKAFKELEESFNSTANNQIAKLPEFKRDFDDLNRRFIAINESMKQQKKPAYYEDNYAVKSGDYLSKIASYSNIYGDASKWGIIYRANRDQISDPNLIQIGMDLKIPRGLPSSWKVYKGESLWKISAYPEVYGKGTKWTLIYRANKDQIKNPDIIQPDQIFSIPRD